MKLAPLRHQFALLPQGIKNDQQIILLQFTDDLTDLLDRFPGKGK
jgi:hypothetical protein